MALRVVKLTNSTDKKAALDKVTSVANFSLALELRDEMYGYPLRPTKVLHCRPTSRLSTAPSKRSPSSFFSLEPSAAARRMTESRTAIPHGE